MFAQQLVKLIRTVSGFNPLLKLIQPFQDSGIVSVLFLEAGEPGVCPPAKLVELMIYFPHTLDILGIRNFTPKVIASVSLLDKAPDVARHVLGCV